MLVRGLLLAAIASCALALPLGANDVQVTVDLGSARSPFPHTWKACMGSGHALLGTRADYREHLRLAREKLQIERIRAHGIFDDDMSVQWNGGYHYYNVDSFYDALLATGVAPLVELSFLPKALADCDDGITKPCSYAFDDHGGYKGLTMAPKNFNDWYELVANFARHLLDRYGEEEVLQWKFEVWNELWGMPFPDDYMRLYNASVRALKDVHPKLQVGGPATMQCQEVQEFIDAVRVQNLPADFVSTHLYPSDPECTNTTQAAQEMDCFVRVVKTAAAKAHSVGLPFYLTELNDGLQDGSHRDTSFAASFVFRMLPQLVSHVEMISWWTFSDIFEEQWFDEKPFHNGFGLISVNGVPKPVFRAFELLASAGKQQLSGVSVEQGSERQTVSAFATVGESGEVQLFLANWDVLDNKLSARTVSIHLNSTVSSPATRFHPHAHVVEINDDAVHPYKTWVEQGSPSYPSRKQVEEMLAASHYSPKTVSIENANSEDASLTLTLPAYGVAVVKLFPHH